MIFLRFTLLLLLISSLSTYAQVSIGVIEKPVDGALLQLKDKSGITNGAANATKGMLLPRVGLTDLAKLYPMYDYVDNIPTAQDMKAHTALLVMNVTESEIICPGIHVWNGATWDHIPENPNIKYFTDIRTSNVDGREEQNTYAYQAFGDAGVWMLSNIRATIYSDGTLVKLYNLDKGTVTSTDSYYYYPPVKNGPIDPSQDQAYSLANPYLGYFYTWNGATKSVKSATSYNEGEGDNAGSMNDNYAPKANTVPTNVEKVGTQGICPNGWHVPSDYEMNRLEKEISNDTAMKYYDNTSNPTYILTPWNDNWNIMKLASRSNLGSALLSPYYGNGGLSRKICDGTSGFSAYLVGFIRNGNCVGKSTEELRLGDYWTSSKSTVDKAWYRSFVNNFGTLYNYGSSRNDEFTSLMMSVRCKKD